MIGGSRGHLCVWKMQGNRESGNSGASEKNSPNLHKDGIEENMQIRSESEESNLHKVNDFSDKMQSEVNVEDSNSIDSLVVKDSEDLDDSGSNSESINTGESNSVDVEADREIGQVDKADLDVDKSAAEGSGIENREQELEFQSKQNEREKDCKLKELERDKVNLEASDNKKEENCITNRESESCEKIEENVGEIKIKREKKEDDVDLFVDEDLTKQDVNKNKIRELTSSVKIKSPGVLLAGKCNILDLKGRNNHKGETVSEKERKYVSNKRQKLENLVSGLNYQKVGL